MIVSITDFLCIAHCCRVKFGYFKMNWNRNNGNVTGSEYNIWEGNRRDKFAKQNLSVIVYKSPVPVHLINN